MIGSNADPAYVFTNIINFKRCNTIKLFDLEVEDPDFFSLSLGAPLTASILEITNLFLLFESTKIDGSLDAMAFCIWLLIY